MNVKTDWPKLKYNFALPSKAKTVRQVYAAYEGGNVHAAAEFAYSQIEPAERQIALLTLAPLLMKHGENRAFQKALNDAGHGPFEALRHSLFAAFCYEQRRSVLAIQHAKTAHGIDPTETNALKILVGAHLVLGDLKAANEYLNPLFVSRRVDQNCVDLAKRVHVNLTGDFDEFAFTLKVALTLINKSRVEEGEVFLEELNRRDPGHVTVRKALASVARHKGDLEGAEVIARKIVDEAPDFEAWNLLGLLMTETSRPDLAVEAYAEAVKFQPDSLVAHSNQAMAMHYSPKYDRARIRAKITEVAEVFERNMGEQPATQVDSKTQISSPLRVGVLSGHFTRHPAMALSLAGWEAMNRDTVHIYAYVNNLKRDEFTTRMRACCHEWHEVAMQSDSELADLIAGHNLDVLVDLSGFSGGRLEVIGRRPAPVQVKWVGGLYNTSGLDVFDWLISDAVQSPEIEDELYAERVYRLPGNYIVFAPPSEVGEVEPLPARQSGQVTFGCFNNAPKINQQLVGLWSRVLSGVSNSRLLLKSPGFAAKASKERILGWFRDAGIPEDRIIFKGKTDHTEHLRTYNEVDVALDSWPYTGGLTTCEALWMGCPVVTLKGFTIAGRHAATHLTAIGRNEWIAETEDEYVAKAVELAADIDALELVRAGLRQSVKDSDLCDSQKFAVKLENALREMATSGLS